MDFEKLANKAKEYVDEHGGTEELQQEMKKLEEIAEGEGTLSEKAKAAAQVAKEYNANKNAPGEPAAPPPAERTPES
jgi:hypothetical protein